MPVYFLVGLDDLYFYLFDIFNLFRIIQYVNLIQVAIAQGFHLFPFRTEKLSLVTPMVLHHSGRVGSRRFFLEPPDFIQSRRLFLYLEDTFSAIQLSLTVVRLNPSADVRTSDS